MKVKNDVVIAAMAESGLYRVNTDGRIETRYRWNGRRVVVGDWRVCDRLDGKNYYCVSYLRHRVKAHRLAYALYHGVRLGGLEINHLDGNRTNNRRENLELCGAQRQSKHAFDTGLNPSRGERHPLAKLSEAVVKDFRARRVAGVGYKKLAAEAGVSARAVMLACTRATWKHVP